MDTTTQKLGEIEGKIVNSSCNAEYLKGEISKNDKVDEQILTSLFDDHYITGWVDKARILSKDEFISILKNARGK